MKTEMLRTQAAPPAFAIIHHSLSFDSLSFPAPNTADIYSLFCSSLTQIVLRYDRVIRQEFRSTQASLATSRIKQKLDRLIHDQGVGN